MGLAASLASGSLAGSLISMLGSFLVVKLISPEDYGSFKAYSIPTNYLLILHLGTFDFLSRELPYLHGQGKEEEARRYAATLFAWSLIASGICAAIFGTLAVAAALRRDYRSVAGWLAQIPVMCQILYGGYLSVTYRTAHDFVRLAWLTLGAASANLLLVGLLVPSPFFGICGRAALGALFATYMLHRYRPLRMAPKMERARLRESAKRGMPLFAAGYAESALAKGVESTMILHYLGEKALGIAALAQTIQAALLIVPASMGQVLLPRMAARYGQTHSLRACLDIVRRPTAVNVAVAAALFGAVAVCVGPAVRWLLPSYAEAVSPVIAAAVVVPIWALRMPGMAFYAAGSVLGYGVPVFVGLGVSVVAATISLQTGGGLEGVFVGSAVGGVARVATSLVLLRLAVGAEARTSGRVSQTP